MMHTLFLSSSATTCEYLLCIFEHRLGHDLRDDVEDAHGSFNVGDICHKHRIKHGGVVGQRTLQLLWGPHERGNNTIVFIHNVEYVAHVLQLIPYVLDIRFRSDDGGILLYLMGVFVGQHGVRARTARSFHSSSCSAIHGVICSCTGVKQHLPRRCIPAFPTTLVRATSSTRHRGRTDWFLYFEIDAWARSQRCSITIRFRIPSRPSQLLSTVLAETVKLPGVSKALIKHKHGERSHESRPPGKHTYDGSHRHVIGDVRMHLHRGHTIAPLSLSCVSSMFMGRGVVCTLALGGQHELRHALVCLAQCHTWAHGPKLHERCVGGCCERMRVFKQQWCRYVLTIVIPCSVHTGVAL